ncbi:anaphase-promoting complex, cyclosome, subunit 3 family protein [Superficieibacter electus]|uniref:Anaphase-promoting complex, cyclosome, subunit 3 family protein n=1 Tax=Superficieibacter electus TaxID=2022662 RepID=A0A2P5GVC1_9ENTR|nr:tetratricopeptide repeat protein [Superficieibacter electus]POP42311.1 anaphase-promoting complex, cyclosome, subunit 3 family protein [Superficieibacter electus]POP50500.1 anaphase-promoting complex, cyclosome, subunit 3 family protein [Superficieibacter electus]
MDHRLQTAIALRKKGEYEKSRQQLKTLLGEPALTAQAQLNIAWSYDNEGHEREAEHWYICALETGLEGDDEFEAKFGLASTRRCLGSYDQARTLFEDIIRQWPLATEVWPFYALCLHNLGEHERAVSMLLTCIAQSPDIRTRPYVKALEQYAQNPNQRWS